MNAAIGGSVFSLFMYVKERDASMENSIDDRFPVKKEDRTWGMLCHLLTVCAYIGIPFGNIIAPLVIWLIKKNESAFVDYAGKEALNFQITMTIYAIIAGMLCFVFIGFLILPFVILFDVIMTIVATVKTNDGAYYRYPVTIRLIR